MGDAKEQLKGMGFTEDQINAAHAAKGKWGLEAMAEFILANPDAKAPMASSGATSESSATTTAATPSEETQASKEERAKKLQERLNQKRLEREAQEKKEALEKEIRRRKAGQEVNQMKEDLKLREMQKQVEQRKQESVTVMDTSQSATQQVQAKPGATETRIQIVCTDGSKLVQTFKASEQLSAVRLFTMLNRKDEHDPTVQCGFSCAYPRKVYKDEDFDKQLKDLGLTPSAALHVTKSI